MKTWNPERARKLVDETGLKRRFIAERIGFDIKYLNNVLIGVRCGRSKLAALANFLGTTVEYLEGTSDEVHPSRGHVA